MNKYIYFLVCADMAAHVAGAKTPRHVVVYAHATWRTRMHVCTRVCVCMCAYVISEIAPFSGFLLTH